MKLTPFEIASVLVAYVRDKARDMYADLDSGKVTKLLSPEDHMAARNDHLSRADTISGLADELAAKATELLREEGNWRS